MLKISWSYNYLDNQAIKLELEDWFGFSYYLNLKCNKIKLIAISYTSNQNFNLTTKLKLIDGTYHTISTNKIIKSNGNFSIIIPKAFENSTIDSILFTGPIYNQLFKIDDMEIALIPSSIILPPILNVELNVDKLVEAKPIIKENKLNIDKLIGNKKQNKTITPSIKPINKILHIICPALNPNNAGLYDREMLAIESIRRQCSDRIDLCVLAAEDPHLEGFRFIKALDTSPPPKSFVKLSEALRQEYSHVLYTNSDCQLVDGFYDKLFEIGGAPTLFHRLDLEDSKTVIYSHGIDGFFFSKEFYDTILSNLPLDFYLGRPHWDTCLGNYLLENNLARVDAKSLIHPKHEKAWVKGDTDYASLSPEEKHNKDLWSSYLDMGLMTRHELEFNPLKLSIIVVFFGTDGTRIDNAKKMLKSLKRQSIDYELVFVEGYHDIKSFEYLQDIENDIYVPVRLEEDNRGLWQKECQMNIGAKAATREIIMFMDADLYCDDVDWLKKVVEAQTGIVLQPWLFVEDDTSHQKYVSYIAKNYCDVMVDIPHNPGMCFCVTRSMLEANDYLNPFYIYGGGDSGFVYEYCGEESEYYLTSTYKHLNAIFRYDTVHYSSNYLNVELKHLYHGNIDNSYFENRHKGLEELSIQDNVMVENGLLKWKENSDATRLIINKVISSKKKV